MSTKAPKDSSFLTLPLIMSPSLRLDTASLIFSVFCGLLFPPLLPPFFWTSPSAGASPSACCTSWVGSTSAVSAAMA